jgi:hypothetical protein
MVAMAAAAIIIFLSDATMAMDVIALDAVS